MKASVNGHDCYAQVLVLDDTVAAGTVSVLVTDELSGRPVSGVTILASDAATGAAIGSTAMTSATGFANLAIAGSPTSVNVSAFHADFGYLTIANYPMTGSRFLSMPLRRNQVDKYGGYKGTLTNVPASPNVHAGIAAMSLPGSITDLKITQLLGPSQSTDIKIGTAIDTTADVPAGVYLGFADQQIKTDISGQGLAGVCVNSSGAPDEANITAGTCGTRTAWALVGDVPLGDLPIDGLHRRPHQHQLRRAALAHHPHLQEVQLVDGPRRAVHAQDDAEDERQLRLQRHLRLHQPEPRLLADAAGLQLRRPGA